MIRQSIKGVTHEKAFLWVVGCSGMFFYPGRVGWSGFVFIADIFGTAARAFWLVAN
jgi:hypothetical protein